MANLVIRPASGAGNKVVVQDQAGAAVLTTADSGATIASGVTGGAGLSGMTSLGTVTSGALGTSVVFPLGSIIQCVGNRSTFHTSVSATQAKLHETSITLKQANSNIYVEVGTSIGLFISYTDVDIALAVGWKTSSTSSTSSDYTSVHNNTSWGRQNVTGLGGYYVQDTFFTAGQGGIYPHIDKNWSGVIDLGNNASGTVIYVSHWASTEGSGTPYFGGPGNSGNDAGKESYINIMEIAA